jgi:hypothetical protein
MVHSQFTNKQHTRYYYYTTRNMAKYNNTARIISQELAGPVLPAL